MIEIIIARQNDLIAALDAFDADAVIFASRALAEALTDLPQDDSAIDADQLSYGLKQAEAARIRVKYLTAWNRQKIDRLAEIPGQTASVAYAGRPR